MKKIFVYDASSNKVQVDLVKYFKYNYTNYFIYTANETDEKGFIKLYVVNVMKELGNIISYNITDEDDWKKLQSIIKTIIKEIKENKQKSFETLDSDVLDNIKIEDARFFKLDPKLVEILSTEKVASNEELIDDMQKPTIETLIPEINIEEDYESLYKNIKQEKEALDIILSKMLREVTEYRLKYGKLEIISNLENDSKDNEELIVEPQGDDDYKNLYLKTKYEKKSLDVVLSKMLREVTEYRLKYGKI